MKKILTFKNTDDFGCFNNYEARRRLCEAIDEMSRDNKVYMVTIEEIEDID